MEYRKSSLFANLRPLPKCPFRNRTLKKIFVIFIICLLYHFIFFVIYEKFHSLNHTNETIIEVDELKTNIGENIANGDNEEFKYDDVKVANELLDDFKADQIDEENHIDNLIKEYERIKEMEGKNRLFTDLMKISRYSQNLDGISERIKTDEVDRNGAYQHIKDRDYVQHYGRFTEAKPIQYEYANYVNL
ncbi:hypothetical protein M8J75_004914 [Diaphorina citri]|nr:hypothetical protein M8J75_004914 [Diaphorina citri]KAI5714563.1 hypothetical protein M8J77_001686 [Diaphorina citri]